MDQNKLWLLTTQKAEIEAELKRTPERLEKAKKQEQIALEFQVAGVDSPPLYTTKKVQARHDELSRLLAVTDAGIAELKAWDLIDKLEQTVLSKRVDLARLVRQRADSPGVALEQQIDAKSRELSKLETELKERRPDSPVVNPVGWMQERYGKRPAFQVNLDEAK